MVADISPEVLFIVHAGDSAVTTAPIESYTLFPSPRFFMRSCVTQCPYIVHVYGWSHNEPHTIVSYPDGKIGGGLGTRLHILWLPYLTLLELGRHRIITIPRMITNSMCQKQSLSHTSCQSCRIRLIISFPFSHSSFPMPLLWVPHLH